MKTRAREMVWAWGLLILVLGAGQLRGEIWGVKSHDEVSQPPATLFHFSEDGTEFTSVGIITLGGAQIDVDGLAMNMQGDLYGFEVGGGNSRLILIDKTSAGATAVGSVLTGRDIRGAVFTASGQLIVLDSSQDQVLRINASDGTVVGVGIDLTLDGQKYNMANFTDIAQRADGVFLMGGAEANKIYQVNVNTGELTLLHTDTANGPDGITVTIAGLAFSRYTKADLLYMYDVCWQDDIFTYQTGAGFSRSNLFLDIIPSYNAGRGDLASLPVMTESELGTSETWWVTYNAALGTLPDAQGWGIYNDPNDSVPGISNGLLHAGPTSVLQYLYWDRDDRYICFPSDHGFVVEFELKVKSSTYVADIGDGRWRTGYVVHITDYQGRTFIIGIASGGVRLTNIYNYYNSGSSDFVAYDTTNAFHTYRFVVAGGTGQLYIDGAPIVSLGVGSTGQYTNNLVLFGDATWHAGGETDMTYIRYGMMSRPGDTNKDDHVNIVDLDTLAQNWLMTGCGCPGCCNGADINHDGRVDLIDFAYLAANWLK